MPDSVIPPARRHVVIDHIRQVRILDQSIGVKHSGITLDIGLLFYEHLDGSLGVTEIASRTGYSRPTVRLVVRRMLRAKIIAQVAKEGRVVRFGLTPKGAAGFDELTRLYLDFATRCAAVPAEAVSPAAAPAPAPGPRSGRRPPRARHAGAPPDREAAE